MQRSLVVVVVVVVLRQVVTPAVAHEIGIAEEERPEHVDATGRFPIVYFEYGGLENKA